MGRQKLESLTLDPWASRRGRELLELLDHLDPSIQELDRAVISEAESRPAAVCLMQQPGMGPETALVFVLTVGPVSRFPNSKKLVSYLGRQRLGANTRGGTVCRNNPDARDERDQCGS